jgi:hypothetical protein
MMILARLPAAATRALTIFFTFRLLNCTADNDGAYDNDCYAGVI